MNLTLGIGYVLFLLTRVQAKNYTAQSTSTIITHRGDIPEGIFQYFYDHSVPNPCDTVLFLGVGTAMGVGDYNKLSTLIVDGKEIITIVMDHNPGWFVKLSATKFANLYNRLVSSFLHLVPVCEGRRHNLILLGGHSASGQAAVEALPNLKRKPDGFIGLDPFQINQETMRIEDSIPTLDWGFARTTCGVNIEQAAKALYQLSNHKHRLFYRVNNTVQSTNDGVAHCVFTDKGCGIVCGTRGKGDWIPFAVAHSIHLFVDAIKSKIFEKETFLLPEFMDHHNDLFMNEDDPDVDSIQKLSLPSQVSNFKS